MSWLRVLFGAALALSGAGSLVFSAGFRSPASARVVGGNLPVNAGAANLADISAHNSPTIARNPVDPGNLAIANRIDLPAFSCALHLSFDGGGTWAQTPLIVPEGEEPKCFVPDVAFGADGALYLSFVTLQGSVNIPNAVWLSTSRDGGRTLSVPTKVLGPLAFQVRLLADPAVAGRIYVSWLQAEEVATLSFPKDGYPVQFTRSDDAGVTWQPAVRVSSPAHAKVVAPSMATDGRGELYAVYLDLGDDRLDYAGSHQGMGGEPYQGHWALVLARSGDGGASWTQTVVDDRVVPTERFIVFLPPFPSLAVDGDAGRLYIGFTDGRSGDADIWVWSSTDKGESWVPPRRVNDMRQGDGTTQYRPQLAVAPSGRLDVVYYDRRSDPDDVMNEVSLQSSFDGGASFTRRLKLSDKAFDSRIGFGGNRGMPELGSKLGLLATDELALAVWSDTRVGTEASNKQDLVRALVMVSAPEALSQPLESGLRYGGAVLLAAGLLVAASGLFASGRRSRPVHDAGHHDEVAVQDFQY